MMELTRTQERSRKGRKGIHLDDEEEQNGEEEEGKGGDVCDEVRKIGSGPLACSPPHDSIHWWGDLTASLDYKVQGVDRERASRTTSHRVSYRGLSSHGHVKHLSMGNDGH